MTKENKNTSSQKKKFAKPKRNAIISAFLVLVLLITGIFAFLTSTDSKVNKFTVGSVEIDLQEYDENGNAWWQTDADGKTIDTLTATVDADGDDVADVMKYILPGDYVGKNPKVSNIGKNEAWTFIAIGIPTADADDITQQDGDNGVVDIEGVDDKDIEVKAFAIQPGYTDEAIETAAGVWKKYTTDESDYDKYSEIFGNEATTGLETRVELFKQMTLDGDNNPQETYNTSDWTQIGSAYKTTDGYNYYIYALNNKLAVGAETVTLVDGFQCISTIGDVASN